MTGTVLENSAARSNADRCSAVVHRPVRVFTWAPGGDKGISTEDNAAALSIGFQPIGTKPVAMPGRRPNICPSAFSATGPAGGSRCPHGRSPRR